MQSRNVRRMSFAVVVATVFALPVAETAKAASTSSVCAAAFKKVRDSDAIRAQGVGGDTPEKMQKLCIGVSGIAEGWRMVVAAHCEVNPTAANSISNLPNIEARARIWCAAAAGKLNP